MYYPTWFVDSVDGTEKFKDGDQLSIVKNDPTFCVLFNISKISGPRYSDDVINIRETVINFLNNEEGQVPWQTENIRRTSYSQSSSVFYNTWSYRKFYCCSYDGTYILVINETYLEIVLQRCFSEKVFWKIFRRAPMLKFNFNKATWQLYWNHTSALVFTINLLHIFQNSFS